LSDGSVHVQQALGDWSTAARRNEDQVVAKLNLREEEPVLAARPVAAPGRRRRE
jgi:hypothetical protein